MRRYASLRDGVTADVGRAIAMATGGAALFIPIEYTLTLWAYAGSTAFESKVRLVALTVVLALWLWLVLVLGLAKIAVVTRLVRLRNDPADGRGPSLFDIAPLEAGIRQRVPRVWAAIGTALAFLAADQRAATWAMSGYKDQQLIAILIGLSSLVIAMLAWPLFRALVMAADVAATAFLWLGPYNPFGRWRAAGVGLALFVAGALVACWFVLPESRAYLNVRLVISGGVVALGMGLGLLYLGRPHRPRTRASARGLAGGTFALVFVTLLYWGGEPETKYLAITASPALERLIGLVRTLNDIDRDGYGSLLGDNDCDPFDSKIHPGDAIDIPDDGIDQNCDGHDFSLASIVAPVGPTMPVPDQFKRDWNVLFLTIDTVRYDHTTFGGYADGPKKRDTTPRLANLVKTSTSFTFTQAPSAGTMASIPAILTSKYFHSGIALDEKRPAGTPPGILPENTTFMEIMRRGNYKVGVIGSHEWWTNWGFEQGVDPEDYDNSIGRVPDANRIVADQVTNHALAWISRQQGKKWFLWAHYIDPHGKYMPHPDVVDYGSSDPDLYDAELKWTDQEVGRLLDELVRLPSYSNTIVVITSDHGESMGEKGHNVTLGTHGTALYRELTHVPMIFYIPENKPKRIRGAVSNLDIIPTIAQICSIDTHDLSFEGRSLVPQLFYGQEDHERIVFSETNAPAKQRAAISEKWRLIFYLNTNVYELFDQLADPLEQTNLAPKSPDGFFIMKHALDLWLARVMYARDPLFNQAFRQMSDVILHDPPNPTVKSSGHVLDGKLEILGIGVADGKALVPGAKVDLHVYFHVLEPTTIPYRFQFAVWPAAPSAALTDPTPPTAVHGPSRATADGAYPADKWNKGDYIRERFPFNVPLDWKEGIAVGVVVTNPASGERLHAVGPAPSNDPYIHALGVLPLGSVGGSLPPPRP